MSKYWRLRIVTYNKEESATNVYMEDFCFEDSYTDKEINSFLIKKVTELRQEYEILSYSFKEIRNDEFEFYRLTTY